MSLVLSQRSIKNGDNAKRYCVPACSRSTTWDEGSVNECSWHFPAQGKPGGCHPSWESGREPSVDSLANATPSGGSEGIELISTVAPKPLTAQSDIYGSESHHQPPSSLHLGFDDLFSVQ